MGHGLYAAFLRKSSIFWGFSGFEGRGDPRKGTGPALRACVSLSLGVVSLCLARGWGFTQRVAGFMPEDRAERRRLAPRVMRVGILARSTGISRALAGLSRIQKSVKDR